MLFIERHIESSYAPERHLYMKDHLDSTVIDYAYGTFGYDANGNLTWDVTDAKRVGPITLPQSLYEEHQGERCLLWDEENRLVAVNENGYVSNYFYDADGQRTVKEHGGSEGVYVNSEFSGGTTDTGTFTLYVSPFLTWTQGGLYVKHVFAGGQRIVSKLGDYGSYGADPRRIQKAGASAHVSIDYDGKYAALQQVVRNNYEAFGVPYNGTDNDDYVNGESFCCTPTTWAVSPISPTSRVPLSSTWNTSPMARSS